MSSVIENSRIKDKCQTFTPDDIVNRMLNITGYKHNIYGKKVLENSCGDGQILIQIVSRYIAEGKRLKLSDAKIKSGLETDIYGYELDKDLICKCKDRLDSIALKYQINNVKWNIINKDFIKADLNVKFDYIIGNPPYIAYPDLPSEEQKYVKKNFITCAKGKFDYSYAFIEKSYGLLKVNGTLVYIIPSNIFKNVYAKSLRDLIISDVQEIIDYPKDRIFKNVLVSPAIIKIIKDSNIDDLLYTNVSNDITNKKIICKSQFSEKWIFDSIKSKDSGTRVGDFFKVSSSVATLLNQAFIFKSDMEDEIYFYVGNYKIEKAITKRAASPKNKKYKKGQYYIVFPYYYDDNNILMRYTEYEFSRNFPFAFEYISQFKNALLDRKAEKNAKWYEFGRSQALKNIKQEKVLISSVISDCTEAYLLEEDEVPYSGLYIISSGTKQLNELCEKLNSKEFRSYISKVGVCVSGTSKRITPKDIENFIY